MIHDYPFGKIFQLRLLAFLVRRPNEVAGIIEPRYFSHPVHVDIARVTAEAYQRHPKAQVSRHTLLELMKADLRKNRIKDSWPLYKKEIRSIFQYKFDRSDAKLMLEQAVEFAKQERYRGALILAEEHVSNRCYDGVHEAIEKARRSLNGGVGARVWTWDNLPHPLDFPNEEFKWLIKGIIPEELASVISGEEGTGKTLRVLDWARALTTGTPWLGRETKMAAVLYLAPDASKKILQKYLRMMRWTPDELFRVLSFWTGEDKQVPMFDKPGEMEKLYRVVDDEKPVVIVDTVRDVYEGDENSSTEVKPVVDVIRRMQSLGGTVILLAHPPKSGNSIIRGSGVLPQKVDIPYLMRNEKWQGRPITVLTCPKKNRAGTTSFSLAVEHRFIPIPGRPDYPYFMTKEVPDWKPSENQNQMEQATLVLEYVREHPGKNQKDISKALAMSHHTVKDILWRLKNQHLVKWERGDRKSLLWYPAEEEE